jgi:protein phosphatase
MEIKIPNLSLVVLIGVSGSGKSSFARKHFKTTEVISSDYCRALVSDNENDQSSTTDAFEVLHFIASKRLAVGRLTVIDATNVQEEARKPLVSLARQYHALPVAIVFDLPEGICQERNKGRADRDFGPHVIRQQKSQLHRALRNLKYAGFRHIYKLTSEEEVNSSTVERVPLWNDRKDLHGPFDIVGDIHGCYKELVELLSELGYQPGNGAEALMSGPVYSHSEGRKMIFLGDVVDRGPRIIDSFRLVYNMVKSDNALCVPGNHDIKLMRKLRGKDVQITHGLGETLSEIEALSENDREEFKTKAVEFIDGLVSHYVLNQGKLIVAHAGLRQDMQGRGSAKVREFCLYGETTGEIDDFGLPVRYNWSAEYRGPATVVYGHTPVPDAEWLNKTINIDTGCVFGGKLTALRYPERELVSVPAKSVYHTPARPFEPNEEAVSGLTAQQLHDDILDAEDVLGKRFITTRL